MTVLPEQIRNADNSIVQILLDPDVPLAIKDRLRAAYAPPTTRLIDEKTVASRRTALDRGASAAERNAAIDYLLSIQQGVDPDAVP